MSQREDIYDFLNDGNTLTPMEALRMFGTMRLGARCFELRNRGVKSRLVRTPGGKHVAQYYIDKVRKSGSM